jgi:hypothetical protein
MWLRLLLRYWHAGEGIPSWIPDMWAGSPMWEMVSAFHLAVLLPLAELIGPDAAVKTAVVGAQVAGAWGAFVLGRSLWSQMWPSAVAGLLYGLHPFFASHGALSGHQPSVWVFAATPWLVWSLRRGLRREGARYLALAGLLVGLVVVEQAEHAFALALLCGFLLVLEVARARRGSGPAGVPGVLVRAGAVVAVGLGVAAHWLLPFLSVGKSFVLMPPEDVRAGLVLFGGGLARDPGAFLSRAEPAVGTMDFESFLGANLPFRGAFSTGFYLSWVCVVLTLVTILWLSRRSDDDGTLAAILLASAIGIWLTMGTVPLAEGGLADREQALGLAAMGAVGGLLVGTFLRRLRLGRRTVAIAAASAVVLFAVPYSAPLPALQRLVPMLESLRFPRFYPIAALGVALGAAYPVLLLQRWAAGRNRNLASLLTASVGLAVVAAFVVDVHPYRTYYRLQPPRGEAAYQEVTRVLTSTDTDQRVATPLFGDPLPISNLLATGVETSVGWPQPQAAPNIWRLTAEVMAASPSGFRNAALGLSATGFVAAERLSERGRASRRVVEVGLEPNPSVLPMVRAYEQTVLVRDGDLTPDLATALAARNVGVVKGGPELGAVLGPGARVVGADRPCQDLATPDTDESVAAEVAMACSMHRWVSTREALDELSISDGEGVGAVFTSPVANLRGISVWLDQVAQPAELVLRELAPDDTFGPEVARAKAAGIDVNGMVQFPFDPRPDSAARRYAFLLSCTECGDDEPKLRVTGSPRGSPNLLVGDRLDGKRAAAFSLQYDRLPRAEPPAVSLQAARPGPGRWDVRVSGTQPSVVVVAESHFPGWKATVDGEDVTVVEADGGFLGVPVPAGHHDVQLRYQRPAITGLGRLLTGLTLVASLALMVAPGQPGRRRRGSRGRSSAISGGPRRRSEEGGARRRSAPVTPNGRQRNAPTTGERDEAVVDLVTPSVSGPPPRSRRPLPGSRRASGRRERSRTTDRPRPPGRTPLRPIAARKGARRPSTER